MRADLHGPWARRPGPNRALGASVLVVLAGLVPIERRLEELTGARGTYVVVVILLVMLLGARVARPYAAPLWASAAILIPIAGLISGSSSSVRESAFVALQIGVIVGLTPFVVRHYHERVPWLVRGSICAFLLTQSISAALGVAQRFLGIEVLGATARSDRANGLAGHPNVLGLMSVIALLVCVALLIQGISRRRTLLVLAMLINIGALVATGSLSSLIALAAGMIVLMIALRATTRVFVLIAALLVGATVVAGLIGIDAGGITDELVDRTRVVSGEADGVASLSIRTMTYEFAWEHIAVDPWIGAGMDATNQGTYNGITVVHSFPLRAWYQGGLILGIVAALILVAAGVAAVRAMVARVAPLAAGVIVAIMAYALTSAFYEQVYYWYPLLFAFAMVPPRMPSRRSESVVR